MTLTLGFDTSAGHCAAALVRGDEVLAQTIQPMARGQTEALPHMLDDLLAQVGLTYQHLDRIGVGIGPGNFTGLRIAVAHARGLALGLDIPALGVTSFDALALGTPNARVLIDARLDRVYWQDMGQSDPKLSARADLPPLDGPAVSLNGIEAGTTAQVHPIATAIALIAAQRPVRTTDRPAPFYMRPADAAPASDPPPVVLP